MCGGILVLMAGNNGGFVRAFCALFVLEAKLRHVWMRSYGMYGSEATAYLQVCEIMDVAIKCFETI